VSSVLARIAAIAFCYGVGGGTLIVILSTFVLVAKPIIMLFLVVY
jgi:hypothetical protein